MVLTNKTAVSIIPIILYMESFICGSTLNLLYLADSCGIPAIFVVVVCAVLQFRRTECIGRNVGISDPCVRLVNMVWFRWFVIL